MRRYDFDLQLFASPAPSGELVSIGLGKETVYGSPVSPTIFLIPSSHGFDGDNTLIERPGARARIGQTEQLTGEFIGKGSMQVEVDPDTFGCPLSLLMGAEAFAANPNNPVAQVVNTTVATGTTVSIGFGPCTPTSMVNIVVGQKLKVGPSDDVVVRAVSGTQFWAYFTGNHPAGATIVNDPVVLAYDHTFTLASPRNSFTAELNDITAAKRAFGAKLSAMSLKLTPKVLIEAMLNAEYQGESHKTGPSPASYSTLRGLVFNTPGNAVTFNGVPLDSAVQGVSFSVATGLVTDYPELGLGRYRGVLAELQTKVTVQLDLAFESETALQYFWGNAGATGPAGQILPVPTVFTILSPDYVNTAVQYGLVIVVPMLKMKGAPVTRKVGDYLKQTVSAECAESINGAGDDIKFILTNAQNAASF